MEIKQLEVFLAVARHLNFSKAAAELFLSQPTVSAYISALEKSLGVQLLLRNTQEVALTQAGQAFFPQARQILALRDQALAEAAGADPTAKGVIELIASTIPAQHLLPEIIAAFRKKRPQVLFRVSQGDSGQAAQRLAGFCYDFGLIGTRADSRFTHIPVYHDALTLALPLAEPLGDDEIRADFPGYIRRNPYIMRESGSGTRAETEALLIKLGLDPGALAVAAYFADTHSILLAVARGMGVALVSQVAANLFVAAGLLRTVSLDSPLFCRPIYLLHHQALTLSPLQQAFVDHARQFYLGSGG